MNDIEKSRAKYIKLRDELLVLVEQGRSQALQAANEALVESYWQIGRRLSAEVDKPKGITSRQLIAQLAPDLGVGQSALYRAVQFFKTYPEAVPAAPELARLNWSYHVELLPVSDPEERRLYARHARSHSWSRDDLRQAIRGKVLTGSERARQKWANKKALLKRPTPGRHAYKGELEHVVDGDTVIVRIELGFDVWKSQRLRLRGIEAPAVDTQEGQQAKLFVARRLKIGQEVVLRTYKLDKYGRYVADLFFGKKIGLVDREEMLKSGRFLNQELLDKGHASAILGAI